MHFCKDSCVAVCIFYSLKKKQSFVTLFFLLLLFKLESIERQFLYLRRKGLEGNFQWQTHKTRVLFALQLSQMNGNSSRFILSFYWVSLLFQLVSLVQPSRLSIASNWLSLFTGFFDTPEKKALIVQSHSFEKATAVEKN